MSAFDIFDVSLREVYHRKDYRLLSRICLTIAIFSIVIMILLPSVRLIFVYIAGASIVLAGGMTIFFLVKSINRNRNKHET